MTKPKYPLSPKALLGGIAHLGRFNDKIKLCNAGQIQDYNYITVGLDKYLVDFLGIDPKAFEQKVLAGGTDEQLLAWAVANGKPHLHEEIAQWSQGLLSSGRKTMRHASACKAACWMSRRNAACRSVRSPRLRRGSTRSNSTKAVCRRFLCR